VIISPAFAQAAPSGDPGYIGLLPIVLMVEALQKGDEVITAGGVVGRITKLSDAYISLEIAPNTEINVQKSAVQVLLPKGTIKSIQ
jgi:preprotein translocase subunit YajC